MEYTRDECCKLFIEHIWTMINYWDTVKSFDGHPGSQRDRLSGLVHSILATIDGESGDMPAFLLIPAPHEDDKEWCRKRGSNWWPEPRVDDLCDLGGGLHEILYKEHNG